MKERRAYLVLVFISIVLSMSVYFLGTKNVERNNRVWCTLINTSLSSAGHVTKPANPKANPQKQKQWEDYEIVSNLGHSLSCY